jgi:MoaA/NifB/PqqE/SkfB family radical SAM enzyme
MVCAVTGELNRRRPEAAISVGVLHSVDLYITTQCNRRCAYCFLPAEFFASRVVMTRELFTAVLKWAIEVGVREVTLLGGEPSLHPNFVEFLDELKLYNIESRVVTNGARRFRKMLGTGEVGSHNLGRAAVSIDSCDDEVQDALRGPGSWTDAVETVAMLREAGVPFDVNVTGVRRVLDGIPDVIEYAAAAGCRRVNIHWPSQMGLGRDLPPDAFPDREAWLSMIDRVRSQVGPAAEYFVEIERGFLGEGDALVGCALADGSNLQIMPDGRVYRCGLLVDDPRMASLRFAQAGPRLVGPGRGEEALRRRLSGCSGCPIFESGERRACIYDKLVMR